jgi:hypothetical protein
MSTIRMLEVTVTPLFCPGGQRPSVELRAKIKATNGDYSVVKQITPEELDTKGLFDIIWEYAGRLLKAELEKQLSNVQKSENNP